MKIELTHDCFGQRVFELASLPEKTRKRARQILSERYRQFQIDAQFTLAPHELGLIQGHITDQELLPSERVFVELSQKKNQTQLKRGRWQQYAVVGLTSALLFSAWGLYEFSQRTSLEQGLSEVQREADSLRQRAKAVVELGEMKLKEAVSYPLELHKTFSTQTLQAELKDERGRALVGAELQVLGQVYSFDNQGKINLPILFSPEISPDALIEIQVRKPGYANLNLQLRLAELAQTQQWVLSKP